MKGVKFVEHTYQKNDRVLIINDAVFQKLIMHRQDHKLKPESGGLLIGRTYNDGNTRIYEITEPMDNDIQSRLFFKRKDKGHLTYICKANERCLYFKGNWHTHPQESPTPSWLDKVSWKSAIKNSKPGESRYIFFIIVGTGEIKVWCGDMKTSEINETEYKKVGGESNGI